MWSDLLCICLSLSFVMSGLSVFRCSLNEQKRYFIVRTGRRILGIVKLMVQCNYLHLYTGFQYNSCLEKSAHTTSSPVSDDAHGANGRQASSDPVAVDCSGPAADAESSIRWTALHIHSSRPLARLPSFAMLLLRGEQFEYTLRFETLDWPRIPP